MLNQIFVFSISLLSFLVLGLFLGAKITAHSIRSTKRLKDEEKLRKDRTYRKSISLLENAKERSLKIVENSVKKANTTINEAESLTKESRKTLERAIKALNKKQRSELERATKKLMELNKSAIEKEKQKSLVDISKATKELENEILQEVDEFKDLLHQEIIKSQKTIDEKIHTEYDEIKRELDQYKKEKLERINNEIFNIVFNVAKETLGKTLNLNDHEELIINALEEAKKEGLFRI